MTKTKALILCGGLGERLRPLTETTPKSLLEIGGKPILQHIIEYLNKFEIVDIAVNTHWLHTEVIKWAGNRVVFSYEPELLGTAGTIKRWIPWLGEDFLVMNGDTLTDLDINDFFAFHKRWDELATISRNPENNHCTGAMIFNRHIKGLLSDKGNIDDDLEEITHASYYKCPGYFDLGTPEKLAAMREVYERNKSL